MKHTEQEIVELLSSVIKAESILRSNQVSVLDPGVEEGNTGATVAVRPKNVDEVS